MANKLKGPLLFLGIIALIIILLFAIPFTIYRFKSKSQCGAGGQLIGSSREGYYCAYGAVCDECESAEQCPDCSEFCKSKGKVKREGYCGPSKIDLTTKLKRAEDGSYYVEEGPVNCYCCCIEVGSSSQPDALPPHDLSNQEENSYIDSIEPKNTEQIVEKDKASENTEIEGAHISEKKEHPYLIIDETMLPESISVAEVYDTHELEFPPELLKWKDYYEAIYYDKVTYLNTKHGFNMGVVVDVPATKQFSKEYFEEQYHMGYMGPFIDGKYAFIEEFEVDSVWRWLSIDENTGESFIVSISSRNGFPETNNALINKYLEKYPPIDASE